MIFGRDCPYCRATTSWGSRDLVPQKCVHCGAPAQLRPYAMAPEFQSIHPVPGQTLQSVLKQLVDTVNAMGGATP